MLWEYYGLSFVWAFYRSVINLSLVCVTILAVLAAEDIFPSEQACFGVCSRVGVVCYVLIPSPAVLGIILFSLELQGSGHLTCGFSFHLPTATRYLYSEN